MLSAVGVRGRLLALPLRIIGVPLRHDLRILSSLESDSLVSVFVIYRLGEMASLPVEEDTAKGLVKVLLESGECLMQDVNLRGTLRTLRRLVSSVVLEDLGDGLGVGEGDQLVVLGDVLPVINKDSLQAIWDLELDRWSSVESVLLNEMLARWGFQESI